MGRLRIVIVALSVLALASCGDDGSSTGSSSSDGDAVGTTVAEGQTAQDAEDKAEKDAKDLADTLEDTQKSEGGGSAKLVVGDSEWTFDRVLCAFGEDEIGQEGAEFVLSSIQDDKQMYVSIDKFGHSVSLDDIKNFSDPSVSLASVGDGFVKLDGKNVTASADFRDGTSDDPTAVVPGTFEATCP